MPEVPLHRSWKTEYRRVIEERQKSGCDISEGEGLRRRLGYGYVAKAPESLIGSSPKVSVVTIGR